MQEDKKTEGPWSSLASQLNKTSDLQAQQWTVSKYKAKYKTPNNNICSQQPTHPHRPLHTHIQVCTYTTHMKKEEEEKEKRRREMGGRETVKDGRHQGRSYSPHNSRNVFKS